MLETALSMSFFLLLIMAIFDFSYMTYVKMALQNSVRQAGRYAITGQCIMGDDGSCTLTRYNSVVKTLKDYSVGLINDSNVGSYASISCSNHGGGCPNGAGGPNDIVTIEVNYPYPFITPLISQFFTSHAYLIRIHTAFTNEPFPPSQS